MKNEWALLALRLRGIERVRLHADLTILARLDLRVQSSTLRPSRGLKPHLIAGQRR